MSISHKSSKLSLAKKIVPIDEHTSFLAHYDITVNDVINGIEPIGATVATLRPFEGKFGGGVALEEGTTNRTTDGDYSQYQTVNYGWDNSLNGTLAPTYWSSYNGGVPSANVGYHAHLNIDRFGYPVMEFPDINGQYGQKHRWLGSSQQLTANVSGNLGWGDGTQVTYSFDMMADSIDKGINLGLYHRTADNSGNTFGSTQTTFYVNQPYMWERKSATVILKASEWDFTQWANLYVYGHYYRNDYEGIGWVKNVQVETKAFPTSFIEGTRNNGYLAYPKDNVLNPSEGTISFWFNSMSKTPQSWSRLFQIGGWTNDLSSDSLEIRWGSGWSSANNIQFQYAQKGVSSADITHSFTINPNSWYFVSFSWKANDTVYAYVYDETNNKEYETTVNCTCNPTLAGLDRFYVLTGSGVSNSIIDELRIDRIKRSSEEIKSWRISQQPFYPKGIYRLAY